MSSKIFTIGYGNRSIQAFIQLIKKYDIEIVIDVRTNPFSRYSPDYRISKFELHLINNDINYLFLGKELGGKPIDQSCYSNGIVDYKKIQNKDFFIEGIEQVIAFEKSGYRIALMCAEASPLDCHRKILIGDFLNEKGFEVSHIDKDGSILNQVF